MKHIDIKRISRRLSAATTTIMAICMVPFAAVASAGATMVPKAGACHSQQISVTLGAGLPSQNIAGQLCLPLYWANNQPSVEVLVHGATYDSSYWDFGYNNAQYSYVNDALLAGHATFNYDNIGTGGSDHPSSSEITFDADASILHQLISWVRQQSALRTAKVDVVAHSKGSAVALQELGTYPGDANALVVTGFLHAISTQGNTLLATAFHSVNEDPAFVGKGLDDGYQTTVPGTRQALFYSASADPQVIAYDEAHKSTFSQTEFASGLAASLAPPAQNISNNITVPVLTMVGQQDALFCGAGANSCTSSAGVQSAEAPYYTHAASFTAQVVFGTGHDIALHPSALLSFAQINAWLARH